MSNNLAPVAADATATSPDTAAPVLNAEDQAATAAAEAALAAAPDTSPLDKPVEQPGRAAERIAEVIAERNAIKEYAEYWRNQATAALPKPAAPAPTVPVTKPAPTLDQFANPDGTYNAHKWSEAYGAWSDAQITARSAEVVKQTLSTYQQQQQAEQASTQWQQRAEAFRAKQPDFDVVIANPALPFNGTLKDLILGSEQGPQIAHYMGQPGNVAEAVRISRMPPLQQAAAFGRLEEKLSKAPPPAKPAITRAPAPPRPLSGATPEINLATCSLDDFLAHRLKKR